MLTPAAIKTQIDHILGYLVNVGLSVDQNSPFIRQLAGGIVEVTFPQAEHAVASMKNRPYHETYDYLARQRAFVARMPDGALLQLRYMFRDGSLQRHVLGLFPAPHLEEFQNNPEIYLEDAVYADVISKSIVPCPIRFDYDPREEVHKPVEHPKSHLTVGQYENCRIPVSSPLTPFWFVEFVLRNFYHTAFTQDADGLPRFTETFDETIDESERKIVFLQIPKKGTY